jgi:hypothetical protein
MDKPKLTVSRLVEAGFAKVGDWSLVDSRLLCGDQIPDERGVYAFSIADHVFYVGLASKSLLRRLYFYGNPGISQTTNIRIRSLIVQQMPEKSVSVYVAKPADSEWNGLKVHGAEGLEAGLIATFDLPWNVKGTGTARLTIKPQFQPQPKKPTAAFRVEELIRKRPRMTEAEIAKVLFGAAAYQQKVNGVCRELISKGLVKRLGSGGTGDPYVYVAV